MLFDVRTRETAEGVVVTVVGDIDVATLPRLAAEVAGLSGHTTIDLSGVDWFDPICLGVLLTAALKARRAGATLEVVASTSVSALLSETRVSEIIDVRIQT